MATSLRALLLDRRAAFAGWQDGSPASCHPISLRQAKAAYMDQTFLLALCVCIGFISGYGVRAMISEHRRREVRKARENARERRRRSEKMV